MAMSKDRVRFYISEKYFRNRQDASSLCQAMQAAFGITPDEFSRLAKPLNARMFVAHSGFSVLCRPSQFARFLIYRNKVGLQNGFKDLKAELIPAEENPYETLAKLAEVGEDEARRVIDALGYSKSWLRGELPSQRKSASIDLSGRHVN